MVGIEIPVAEIAIGNDVTGTLCNLNGYLYCCLCCVFTFIFRDTRLFFHATQKGRVVRRSVKQSLKFTTFLMLGSMETIHRLLLGGRRTSTAHERRSRNGRTVLGTLRITIVAIKPTNLREATQVLRKVREERQLLPRVHAWKLLHELGKPAG
jgi:hypothetical protein